MLALATPHEKRFAYGFWRFEEGDVETAITMLGLAREMGIDHIDTADVYGGASGFGGAEKLLGAVRACAPALFDGATLATKAGVELGTPYNAGAQYLKAACEASLKRLGVERVDLFYIHRHDLLAHPEEVASALESLVASGKIAAIGVSNYTPSQLDALARHLTTSVCAVQVEISPLHVSPILDSTLDQAMRDGMAVAAWSPLAGGRLVEGTSEAQHVRVQAVLARIAAGYDVDATAVAMAFLQRHPAGITPILGTKTPSRLTAAMEGARINLSRREWYDILEASLGSRMP